MRSRIFKLFLIFMLVVGIFVNNKAIIKADDRNTEGLIVRNGDKFFEYVWQDDTCQRLVRTSRSTMSDQELNDLGLDISGWNAQQGDGIKYVLIRLTKDASLLAPEDGSPIIESEIPILITDYDGTKHKLSLTTNYLTTQRLTEAEYIGIRCDGILRIKNVDIDIFPELEGKSLNNKHDVFNNFVIHQHDYDIDGNKTHGIITESANVRAFGTKSIYITGDKDYGVPGNGSIQTYDSIFDLNIIYPKTGQFDYGDIDEEPVELESELLIGKGSSFLIKANVPEIVSNDSESHDDVCVERTIISTNILTVKDSSLSITDENFKYECAVQAGRVEAINSSFNIYGGLMGIYYTNPDEGKYDDHLVINGDEELVIENPGVFFDESIVNITSYFVCVFARTSNPNPEAVPISLKFTSGNKNQSTIRIMGSEDEAEALDLDRSFVRLLVLTDVNKQFKYSVDPSKYEIYSSDVSSLTIPPKFSKEFNIDNLAKYRALRIEAGVLSQSILVLYNSGKNVGYVNGITKDTEIPELNVSFDQTNGYTINVLEDYQFTKGPNDTTQTFIGCSASNLRIIGENKKLRFNVNHSQDEKNISFKYITVDPAYNTVIEGVSKDKLLNIEVTETGTVSENSLNFDFLGESNRGKQGNNYSADAGGSVSFDYVDIQAKIYSGLVTLPDCGLSIDHSNINYANVFDASISIAANAVNVLRAITVTIENSEVDLAGNNNLCSKTDDIDEYGRGIYALNNVIIKNCEKIKISNFDTGIKVRGKVDSFTLVDSSLDINCNKFGIGIQGNGCSVDLYNGNKFHVSVSKVLYKNNKYLNPAIAVPSYVEEMIKVPKGIHIVGVTYDGQTKEITSTETLGNFKTIDVDAGDPESEQLLIVSTHGSEQLQVEPDDCPEDDPVDEDPYYVYFDEDLESFVVTLKQNLTFERKKGDTFREFIECRNVGLILKGDVTITFKYDLEDASKYIIGGWFRCFDIDENYDFAIEGLSEDERLKIVVEETTNTDTPISVNNASNSIIFRSDEPSDLFTKGSATSVLSIENVDIEANTFGQFFSLGGHDTEIINSNINFELYPLNFKEEKPVIDKTCFQTVNDIYIEDSNIEIIGDDILNNFGDEDSIEIDVNGAMISQGSIDISSTTGEHHIRIKDYLFGIGAFGNITIEDMNLDVEGHRGGIGSAFGSCSISLSSTEGYVKVKSNVKEHPVMSLTETLKLPAVFGAEGAPITPPLGSEVYAYDIDHNKTTYNQANMFDYVYVTIQEEKAPIPVPEDIKEVRPFKGPTSSEPGELPYYQDENGYYYEDPEGKNLIGTYDDLQEWLENSTIPALKYTGSLVTIDYKEKKYIPIEKIIVPVTDNDNYVLMLEVEKKKLAFKYLIINGVKVPPDMIESAVGDVIALRLKPEFINSLIVGSNVNAYIVTDTGSAFTSFKIEKKHVDPPYNPGYVTPKTGIK